MATLEGAAEQLVVKLRGLDSEIEESEQKLEALTERVETVARDVEKDWTALAEAAASLLDRLREGQQTLQQQDQQTVQALNGAHRALAEEAAQARSEVAEGRTALDGLAHHATVLEPGVDSLAAEAGESPAVSLAERARDLQQELARIVEEARDFLRDDVVPAAEQTADEVREACGDVRRLLADEAASLQHAFDEWESKVDGLEDYVMTQGYKASHQHARDVVEYAVEECDTGCRQHLDDLQQLVGVLLGQLKDMAGEIDQSVEALVTRAGADLLQELEGTRTSATDAVAALDRVKQQLSSYSFVEV
jgi:chromosome segregation ATPase